MASSSKLSFLSILLPQPPSSVLRSFSVRSLTRPHAKPHDYLTSHSPKVLVLFSDYHDELKQPTSNFLARYRYTRDDYFEEESDEECNFNEAVSLFNSRDYYKCHDVLEALWNKAEEPARTLIHGILQCAVGFHHLFNQNHRGAMMELGEGLCKLRKMNFTGGPFHQFEQEISAALDFIYQTQVELAACTEDFCLQMDGSERSYQLLGSFAAGQHLYCLDSETEEIPYIIFSPESFYSSDKPLRIKIPTLHATEEHLKACEY